MKQFGAIWRSPQMPELLARWNRAMKLSYPISLMVVALALSPAAAVALTYTVGTPVGAGQCSHATVQAAVNAALINPGADFIRITRTMTWTAQQVDIDTTQNLDLLGGFATCTSPFADSTRTTLNGSGGQARPVITIRGDGLFRLRNLTITGGDQGGTDNGGGIFYEGGGILDIADTAITANSANDGGGIYATGTTILAEVVLGANVTVSSNIARNSGGGMVSKSLETSIVGPGTTFIFNEARGLNGGGYGGGLAVVSDQFKSIAYISSNGIGGIGAIYSNEAKYGGGIAILAGTESGEKSEARIFSTQSGNPVRIHANTATQRGGGIYLKSDSDDSSGDAYANARLWNAALADNTAPDGAAAYLDYDESTPFLGFDWSSTLTFNESQAPTAAVACLLDQPCGYVTGNSTGNTTGAIFRMPRSQFSAERVEFSNNTGGRLFYLTNSGGEYKGSDLTINNSLMANNILTQELIRLADDDDAGSISMNHVTVTANAIGTPHVIHSEGRFHFDRSIVAQPGKITLAATSGIRDIEYVLTNDTSNMTGAFFLIDPRFVDPANHDFRLRAGSPAVDFAPDIGGWDLGGRLHTTDMPFGGILSRTADAGAYERPALQPLVLNSDFNTNLNLWIGLSDSFWDATTNASGPSGSGSVRVPPVSDPESTVAPLIVGRSQCVHLPGPGRYRLNGWGKVTTTMFEINSVMLRWELRYNGGASGCETGAANLMGTHSLASTNTWRRPPNAAVIDVPEAAWTRNASLTIKLDTAGNQMPPIGWFDGITLDIDAGDVIFAHGFE